jgi:putative transposase
MLFIHVSIMLCGVLNIEGVDKRLKSIILEVAEDTDSEVIEMEIMPDHVHLLVECDPQFGIHKLIRMMKGRSSRYLRNEFPWFPFPMENSYFVSTAVRQLLMS